MQTGRAQAHHILPESGWISLYLRQPEDVGQAITLLSENYQIARKQKLAFSKKNMVEV